MKRIDAKFLLVQVVILLAISAIIGIIISVAVGGEEPIAGKTMEKNLKKEFFNNN